MAHFKEYKMSIVNVSDIVEKNGKTFKENNMSKKHSFPIGSLVEIMGDDGDDDVGIRLYVVSHSRDCDGTPLYGMSFKRNSVVEMEERKKSMARQTDDMGFQASKALYHMACGSILLNYSEDSLKLIK